MRLRAALRAIRDRIAPGPPIAVPDELDLEFYVQSNPDLKGLGGSPRLVRHYVLYGRAEGRPANRADAVSVLERRFGRLPAGFDPDDYLDANPELRASLCNSWEATEHFIKYGRREGRPHYAFDPELYRALNFGEVHISDEELRRHYESTGRAAGMIASGAELMAARGLPGRGAWIARFDLEAFKTLNWSWVGQPANKLQAIEIFLREGLDRLARISFELEFDPSYYRDVHPDLAGRSDRDLYRRWLLVGLDTNEAGSAPEQLKRLALPLERYPEAFDWKQYAATHKLRDRDRWTVLEHLLEHPDQIGPGPLPVAGPGAAECLAAMSIAFAFRHDKSAIRLAELAFAAGHQGAGLLQAMADSYYREERWAEALDRYQTVASLPDANVWTFCNGARAAAADGQLDAAFVLLEAGRSRAGGERVFQVAVREAIEAEFDAASTRARKLYLAQNRSAGDALLAQAVETAASRWAALDPIGAPLPAANSRRVVMLANTDLRQCTHYRVEQKAQLFESLGLEAEIFSGTEVDEFISALPGAAAALFYRLPATPLNLRAIEAARVMGLATYYEIDDLIFADPYPEPLETYGAGVDAEVYAGLQAGVPLFQAAMARCDYGIASTTALARLMKPIVVSGRVFVVPNGLDARNEGSLNRRPDRVRQDDDVVIFYGSGTRAHNSDFLDLAGPALADAMERHPGVRLLVIGYVELDERLSRYQHRITMVGFTPDVRAYWSLLAEADINLAMLTRNAITDAKSEIKWLEAAALAIPSIVSDTATYREVVEDGVDGLIVGDTAAWGRALEWLITDPEARRRIGERAREKARERYTLSANAPTLAAALAPALDRPRPHLDPTKPRILLVNVFFPPQTIGGATRVVRDNVDDFLASGVASNIEFGVVSTDHGAPAMSQRIDRYRELPVFRLAAPEEVNMDWRPLNPDMWERFAEILELWRPDLVHFHSIQRLTGSVVQACRAAGVPYVVTVHDGWWICDYQFLVDERGRLCAPTAAMPSETPKGISTGQSLERRRVLGPLLAGAQTVFGVSEPFTRIYRACGYDNAVTVANGVSDLAPRPKAVSASGRVRLAHVGGQSAHKGYHLIEAALKHGTFQNLVLTVVDHARFGGPERWETWGITPVRFVGKTPQEQMAGFYAEHDVLLAPSIWPESYGLVAREALGCGLWVIAGDRGAMAEDVKPEINGLVVDVSSPQGVFEALQSVDAAPARYLTPPPPTPLRQARDQAADLLDHYKRITSQDRRLARAPIPAAIIKPFADGVSARSKARKLRANRWLTPTEA